ncbi:MAG: 30S ribosomal protein S8e [Candidatus Aenigmatarchaeota archaeon]
MGIWHLVSKRKPTGAKLRRNTKKSRAMRGSTFLETTIDERTFKQRRTVGGRIKNVLLTDNVANVLVDTKTNKYQKSKILSVEKNPANIHYSRRNVMTRGAIIKTELGEAVVTSRPAQHGLINARLIKK